MRSHTKSFKYAGGCLVRFPRSRGGDVLAGEDGVATEGGGVLTSGLLCSTSGASCPPLVVISSPSSLPPDGAHEGDGGGVLTGGLLCSTSGASCPSLVVMSSFSSLSPDRALLAGGFCTSGSVFGLEVLVAGLTLEAEGLALEAVGALPLMEVAFLALPSLLSTARLLHILVHVTAARALFFASWGLSCRTGASPIGFQAGLILNKHLS